ncbi:MULTISPECIES: fimbrial biogenesis chaperone [unclassified Pseudocitrobacter]|uniref:fimbrial biogenesis chaperone n=1 Tax=unclassified Pseudocitrobacter TaxID=2638778 RepID=UPI0023E3CC02|nr:MULTISPECIES: molecular chaperone [unclassified Pseudocitrobacter]MDF3831046.1 molecular chaperone [Pseudocitrobacter sp. 2023EL-00150]MEC5373948.1 molecular chaperone [Pseudocitrobacter sp. MW920760]
MKLVAALSGLLLSLPVLADSLLVNGTRFIYKGSDKELTVQLSNAAGRPSLAQVWLDNGDPEVTPDKISTPFIINPPVSRIDGHSGQVIRIKLAPGSNLPTNKESIWWINVLDIPGTSSADKAPEGAGLFKMAVRSRFKLIYRPTALAGRADAIEKLKLQPSGSTLTMTNPTPFYITVATISAGQGDPMNSAAVMIPPLSSETVTLNKALHSGEEITLEEINDYGALAKRKATVG